MDRWLDVVDVPWFERETEDWKWWMKPGGRMEIYQPEPRHPMAENIDWPRCAGTSSAPSASSTAARPILNLDSDEGCLMYGPAGGDPVGAAASSCPAVAAVLAALALGRYAVSVGDIVTLVMGRLGIGPGRAGVAEPAWRVVELVRFPHADRRLRRRRASPLGGHAAGRLPQPAGRSACHRRLLRRRLRRGAFDPARARRGRLWSGLWPRAWGGPARRADEPPGRPLLRS